MTQTGTKAGVYGRIRGELRVGAWGYQTGQIRRYQMNNGELKIRQASAADINYIVGFQMSMAQETEGKALDSRVVAEGVRGVLNQTDRGQYFLAEYKSRVVGSLLITYEWSDWRNANFWWIQSVYVDPLTRRKGVYSALHKHILDIAKSDSGVCGVRLYVDRENTVAQSAYNRLDMSKSRYDIYESAFE